MVDAIVKHFNGFNLLIVVYRLLSKQKKIKPCKKNPGNKGVKGILYNVSSLISTNLQPNSLLIKLNNS